ncbi:hypothetical protein CYLTODRAFT_348004 [Cylindrobasidium torrendii FP15055 ss-10]|uniref:DUF6589 domain-containing protein n=1 Tax=Cylindrobasidium torrendii FP15055 ss-10 TaxID=1314674 RepID=A0A0D7BIN7_9AGAR|nr:hypothetical protein CYLTODRAFT_348004 [Cylindrobasidium torrendii FP15055 ss-10]
MLEGIEKREGKQARHKEPEDPAAKRASARAVWKDARERGFGNPAEFIRHLVSGGGEDSTHDGSLSQFYAHASDLASVLHDAKPGCLDDFVAKRHADILRIEASQLKAHFSRNPQVSLSKLLQDFSLDNLAKELPVVAPTLWELLRIVGEPVRPEIGATKQSTRRDPDMIRTTIFAMLAISLSQRANTFQTVIGLFLIGSGVAKKTVEVLSHAGFCASYSTILEHIGTLSNEATQVYRKVMLECMCSIVWDNLNIAFRVEAQRMDSQNHFDNGTTATLIALRDPATGARVPHGTLPLDMKPPRTSSKSIESWTVEQTALTHSDAIILEQCSLWQLRQLAIDVIPSLSHLKSSLEPCPTVEQIKVHKTEQYPLPALHEDESSIDGTLSVYKALFKAVGVDSGEKVQSHGLFFLDGDQLTESLINKLESARRNGNDEIESFLSVIRRFGGFHAKMAGCRAVVNEHWNKHGATSGLWFENNQTLQRKNMVAGWEKQKATRWKVSHELIELSIRGHILDALRISCGHEDIDTWALFASKDDFNTVTRAAYDNLFTTMAYEEATDHIKRDTTFENSILQNRDMLWYVVLVNSVRAGDIGRVILVYRVWMVMMRTPKTMPKYADAFFKTFARLDLFPATLRTFFLHNWLVNITGLPNRFKEIDLLQEHLNFWAKIIYNAKGVNRTWEWLAKVTVCIYALRDAMRTVQKAYKIPEYGLLHTVPDMAREVGMIADVLRTKRVQEYAESRPNEDVRPVRDLYAEGSKNANTRKALTKFTAEQRRARVDGFLAPGSQPAAVVTIVDIEDDAIEEPYNIDLEDLEMDPDEAAAYDNLDFVRERGMDMVGDMLD